jgi:cytoskeletal protein RodZ
MTDPEALAYEDVVDDAWDSYPADDWNTYPVAGPVQPAKAPWFRNPSLLFGLIAMAAAALVVATVLLITGKQSGEIPTTPDLSTRATPSVRSTPRAPSGPAPSTPESSSTPETSTESAEETAAPAEPEQPAEPPAAPLPPSPSASQSKSPAGPKINVTRTPMSFTPGKH